MATVNTEITKLKRRTNLNFTFTPGTPVAKADLFSGRGDQIRDVIDTITQPGRHVVLYGERGVGKTSLAKVLAMECGTMVM